MADMKPYHAAALALVVYLMVPPSKRDADSLACAGGSQAACLRESFDPEAPISKWQQLQSFDTAEACETFRNDQMRMLENCPGPKGANLPCPPTPELTRLNLDLMQQGRCVSSDDPRLKGN